MVIDTSALIAILNDEPERLRFNELILADPTRLVSAASVVEAGIVRESAGGDEAGRELDLFLHLSEIEVVAVDSKQASMARRAYRRFGKGAHPARLNFGDCFSYALSQATGEPLLFKGDDFPRTDVTPAHPAPPPS